MNKLDYTSYDFDSLVSQFTTLLSKKDSWKDTYRSSTGQMIIELLAYVANLILYSIERSAEEQYLDTAQLRSSVINLTRILNYKPRRVVSARGKLQFTLTSASGSVIIPKYTECQSTTGIKVLTLTDVLLSNVVLPYSIGGIDAIQGVLVNRQFYSNGKPNQFYNLNDTDIENTILDVYISGTISEPWEKVDSFLESKPDSTHYVLRPELDGTLIVVFGDGFMGKIPPIDSIVNIKYVKSLGSAGNIYATGVVTTINNPIADVHGNTAGVSVTNTSAFLGGDDQESVENIKNNAPKVFATGDRLVTKDDFLAVIKDYPAVADVNVWGEKDVPNPDYDMFNRVKIAILLDSWQLASVDFKNTLSVFLYSKSILTIKYQFVDPVIVLISVEISLVIKSNFSLSDVQNNVTTAIENEFLLGQTVKLGTPKRFSDMAASIQNVNGVSYHHSIFKVHSLFVWSSLNSRFETTVPLINILTSSLTLYLYDPSDTTVSTIAADDGSGNFTNIVDINKNPHLYAVSGNINYTSGFVYFTQNGGPTFPVGSTLYVLYVQGNGKVSTVDVSNPLDLIVGRNQVCRLIYDGVYAGVNGVNGVNILSAVYE